MKTFEQIKQAVKESENKVSELKGELTAVTKQLQQYNIENEQQANDWLDKNDPELEEMSQQLGELEDNIIKEYNSIQGEKQ